MHDSTSASDDNEHLSMSESENFDIDDNRPVYQSLLKSLSLKAASLLESTD